MASEPRWLAVARNLVGVREIPGARHNPTIMGWVRQLGSRLGIPVKDDETPWCGTFAAWCMVSAGHEPPPIAVRASAWASWGRRLNGPRLGCVLVFTRKGGGHVGFYIGEDRTHYHVLGGNQSNAVNVMRLEKSRLAPGGMRWPKSEPLPVQSRIWLRADGTPSSENEA